MSKKTSNTTDNCPGSKTINIKVRLPFLPSVFACNFSFPGVLYEWAFGLPAAEMKGVS